MTAAGGAHRTGAGALVLIVGPSGAGKDTLIGMMRARAAGQPIVLARRVVTRAASQHEDHDSMTEADFARAEQDSSFALSWQAHGLRYGVPAAIDDEMACGRVVVCNASRAVIEAARSRYARCRVVLVTAPEDVLLARVTSRLRPSDGSATRRVARPAPSREAIRPDLVIENVGDPADAAALLFDFVMRQIG
ncbi:MAG TPA: phosphonate metabolism protein/1,5-bisphosphokinase (PRPP-forming) PhnN [Xanthobacteraceae bacterium]|nr:phosphonate metabolism protein/1,5-bisphosphokinase (PRPP-forming) PhnN [Xanthobacteraceae bacterium]